MHSELIRAFQRQVLFQCNVVLRAEADLKVALGPPANAQEIFYALQNLLNAAANLSKAFWGSKGRLSEQRKPLRESLGVADESALKETGMRNHYEHYDERLDRWWAESEKHSHVEIIGPNSEVLGIDPIDRLRRYAINARIAYFWGEDFDIGAIVDEVQRLLPRVQEEAIKPLWDD